MSSSSNSSENIPHINYIADGRQRVFSFPFLIFEPHNIKIYLNKTIATGGYSVSIATSGSGGNVTFSTAPASDTQITITRELIIRRVTDFQEGGEIRSKALNHEFNYQIACTQQVAEDVSRAFLLPAYADNNFNRELPTPEANKALVWNSQANSLTNSKMDISNIDTQLHTALNQVNNTVNTAVTNVNNKINQTVSNVNNQLTQTTNNVAAQLNQTVSTVNESLAQTNTSLTTLVEDTVSQVATDLAATQTKVTNDLNTAKNKVTSDLNTTKAKVTADLKTATDYIDREVANLSASVNTSVGTLTTEINTVKEIKNTVTAQSTQVEQNKNLAASYLNTFKESTLIPMHVVFSKRTPVASLGTEPLDGQVISKTKYPEFWTSIVAYKKLAAAGNTKYAVYNYTEANWQTENASGSSKGYVINESAGTVRLPHLVSTQANEYFFVVCANKVQESAMMNIEELLNEINSLKTDLSSSVKTINSFQNTVNAIQNGSFLNNVTEANATKLIGNRLFLSPQLTIPIPTTPTVVTHNLNLNTADKRLKCIVKCYGECITDDNGWLKGAMAELLAGSPAGLTYHNIYKLETNSVTVFSGNEYMSIPYPNGFTPYSFCVNNNPKWKLRVLIRY